MGFEFEVQIEFLFREAARHCCDNILEFHRQLLIHVHSWLIESVDVYILVLISWIQKM